MAEEIYMTKEEYASDEQGVVKDAKFAYQAGEAAASKLAENSFYLDGKGPTWYASKDALDGVQGAANNAQESANNAQTAAANAQTSATLALSMAMDKVSKSDVVQTVGVSDTSIMSQNAVTNALADKIVKTDIVQETGTNEDKIMSQKAVTDALAAISGGGGIAIEAVMSVVYPVGSIYMSANDINPSELFGGTWEEWGCGKVPVGVDTNDVDFNSPDKTGGAKTVELTGKQSGLPAHGHTFTGSAVTSGGNSASHTHSISITSGSNSASHTHSGAAHTHSYTITAAHSHNFKKAGQSPTYTWGWGQYGSVADAVTPKTNGAQLDAVAQSSLMAGNPIWTRQNVCLSTENAAASTGNTGGASATATGTQSANHTHSVSGTSGGNSVGHTHSVTAAGTVNSHSGANAAEAHNNLQPYVTCYMWKRTA